MKFTAIAALLFLLSILVHKGPTYALEWQADGGVMMSAAEVQQLVSEIAQMQHAIEAQQKRIDTLKATSGCS